MEVIVQIVVLWDVTLCSFVGAYQNFRGTCSSIFRFQLCWVRNQIGYTGRLQRRW
jgi:hypothetical protein